MVGGCVGFGVLVVCGCALLFCWLVVCCLLLVVLCIGFGWLVLLVVVVLGVLCL